MANKSEVGIHRLQVILKVVERCNLACTYCYYFFGDDQTYKERPAVIKLDTISALANFLAQGASDLRLGIVQVIFHGGEPLLLKKRVFDEACDILTKAFSGHATKFQIGIQTNATLIDADWIDLLIKHNVFVGVSIDGPEQYNDTYRIDHKGKGSHARVSKGIQELTARYKAGATSLGVGSISVLRPEWDQRLVFDHLANDLGLTKMSFLLPDSSHDSLLYTEETVRLIGHRMCEIFDKWTENPHVEVLQVLKVLNYFQLKVPSQPTLIEEPTVVRQPAQIDADCFQLRNQVIDIQSDGAITADDSLLPAQRFRESLGSENIRATTLQSFLGQQFFQESWAALTSIPSGCSDCAWKLMCRGGDMENRFKDGSGFDNPSVYCEALKMFYERIVRYMIRAGYPMSRIVDALQLSSE